MARTTTRTVTALVLLALGVAAEAQRTPTTTAGGQQALADQTAAPSVQHAPQPEPNYHYRYAVASRKTGDVKGAWEKRAGEDVWGAYFLRDPDGRWRTVHYEADGTGFYATVQRRPLYRGGRLEQSHQAQHGEPLGANAALPLDDDTWKSALAAAKHSSREDNHPALLKARGAGGVEGAASTASYTTTRAPAGYGFSSPAASFNSYSTTRAPAGFGSSPAASFSSYYTTRSPSSFGFSSPAASVNSYSTTRAPGFGSAKGFAKHSLLRQSIGGSAFPAYRSQQLRAGRPAPSYSSAYASEPFRPEPQQEQAEEDADDATTVAPSTEAYANQEEESQAAAPSTEDPEAERFADPQGAAESAPYRASDNVPQHQEDEGQDNNEAVRDDEKDDDDEEDKQQRDEESEDAEHNPDDDHEAVPEQALQGSQLRHDHEALQAAPLRLPQLHVHQLQQQQGPQVREPDTMDHLLGPAWAEVESHSGLFEGQDFPLFRANLRNEETPQDTQEVPTWAQRERADRAKSRRAAAQGLSLNDAPRGRAKGGSDRGAGRFPGTSRGNAAFGSGDRTRGGVDDRAPSAPSTESTWSFGSKVRGKEDDAAFAQPAAAPARRGKNQNRGPVLFGGQQVEASTPAGERRPPPRGYSLSAAQDDKAAWQHAKRSKQPVSYSGWLPLTASLQAGESFSTRDPRPGAPRGRRRAPSKLGGGDSAGASALWTQSWF